MPLKITTPKHFTEADREYRYLNGKFNIEERFQMHTSCFRTADKEEEELKAGSWSKSDALDDTEALWFFVLLSVGKVGAAQYLSDCIDRNMGFTAKDDLQEDLSVFIVGMGAILGDPQCLEVIARTGTIRQTLGTNLEPKAQKCSGYITDHARDFAEFESEGKTIYLKDVLGYAKEFNRLIEDETGMSYLDNMPNSDFKYYLGLTEIHTIDETPLAGVDGDAPSECCLIM